METVSEKKEKRQCKAYKKWTDLEQLKLINFLKEHRPIEKSNAQTYYRRFLTENGMDCEWNLVRSKVRNMRQSYQKCKAIRNSTGAGTMNPGETIRGVILKRCPLFEEYEEVFGYREDTLRPVVLDTEATDFQLNLDNTLSFEDVELQGLCENNENRIDAAESVPKFAKRARGIYSHTGLSAVLQVQSEIISMRKRRKEEEIQLKKVQVELEREKFLFEKESKEKDRQMKRELRIMEMEMKKEIALKELEMKHKIKMEKMKMPSDL